MIAIGRLSIFGPTAAAAQDTETTQPPSASSGSASSGSGSTFVDVVKISGLIDPVLADFLEQSLHWASEVLAGSVTVTRPEVDRDRHPLPREHLRRVLFAIRHGQPAVDEILEICETGTPRTGTALPASRAAGAAARSAPASWLPARTPSATRAWRRSSAG